MLDTILGYCASVEISQHSACGTGIRMPKFTHTNNKFGALIDPAGATLVAVKI